MHQYTGGRGWFGTVGGGYDWQFAPRWVAGILADTQFGDLKGSILDVFQNYPGSTKNNLNYAVGVRLGYLVAPSVLSYVNGGYSHADFTQSSLTNSDGTSLGAYPYTVVKQHHDGWFIGGGVENALNGFGIAASGWFMKTEYRLASYGRQNITLLGPTGAPTGDSVTFKPTVQTVSTSLVYRFK
jgi:outer membrane immunogenic protein